MNRDRDPRSAPVSVRSVEYDPNGADTLVVEVYGEWRATPEAGARVVLVLQLGERRHRFTALPEEVGERPGLLGGFRIPVELESALSGAAALEAGGVEVTLPPAVQRAGGRERDEAGGDVVEPAVLAERRARRAEEGRESALRRAAQAETLAAELSIRVARLERELAERRVEPESVRAVLGRRERELRLAEQRAHADAVRADELAEEAEERLRAAHAETEELGRRLATAEAMLAEALAEAEDLRRAAAEADHLAATERARARSARAEAAPVPVRRIPARALRRTPDSLRAAALGVEWDLWARVRERGLAAVVLPAPSRALGLDGERAAMAAHARRPVGDVVAALERLRDERDAAEIRLSRQAAQLVAASGAIADARGLLASTAVELAQMRPLAAAPVPARAHAFSVPARAPEPAPGPGLEPDRLDAALARLRATAPTEPETAGEPIPVPALPPAPDRLERSAWVPDALRRLARHDGEAAGAVVLALLPLQHHVTGTPLAYDLVLPDGVRHVEADGVRTTVADAPGAGNDFTLRIDPAGLGRLATTRRLRGRGQGSIDPRRARGRAVRALRALGHAPVALHDLRRNGIHLPADSAWRLIAEAVDPRWTEGNTFRVQHETPGGPVTEIAVTAGRGLVVAPAQPGAEPPDAVLRTPPEAVLPVLLGEAVEGATIAGDSARLDTLRGWIARLETA